MHLISTLLLGPLLLLQGWRVRRNIELLPEPYGAREGTVGSGKVLKVLVLGDSAAAGVGATSQDNALLGCLLTELKHRYEVRYLLAATTGHKTVDCINRLNALPAQTFDVVLISLGVNDVTGGVAQKTFTRQQAELIKILQVKFAAQQIILSGLPPMSEFPALPQPLRWYLGAQAKRFDSRLENLATARGLEYLRFEFDGDVSVMASDGFHPGPKVYAKWAELAAQRIS